MLKIGANTQVQWSSLFQANNPLDLMWGLEKASENACDQIYLVIGIVYLEEFLGTFCKNVLKILGKLFHADKWYFQPHGQNFVTKIWGTSTFLEGQMCSCKIFPQYLQKLMKGVVNSIEYCERPVSDQILIHEFPQSFFSAINLVFFQGWTPWYTLSKKES